MISALGAAMGQNWVSGGTRKVAGHRPRCTACAGSMRLTRMAPAKRSVAFRVEYTFECSCGQVIAVDEAELQL